MRNFLVLLLPTLIYCCEKPRIFELIPGMEESFCPLLIEPALPEDYVTYAIGEDFWNAEVLWGCKATLEKFKMALEENRADIALEQLKNPIICVFLTTGQTGPDSFQIEYDDESFILHKNEWAQKQTTYPILEVEGRDSEGKKVHTAYVGLNDPDGHVMQFNFIYPQAQDAPSPEELQIWNHFLTHTKVLPERDLLKAKGIELHKGYTVYKQPGGIKVKILVEKRKSSRQFRIVAEPLNEETFISIQNIHETPLETEWHNGEPAIFISCNVRAGNTIQTTEIPVAYKLVEEFVLESPTQIELFAP